MASIEEQSWESFSAPWNVDVKIAFEVGRAALARPLRPGSTVLIVSSGAGLTGSPLSGGYAGAKRMQMFLAGYLQRAADARGLGIRFVGLAPRQLLAGTAIGEAAAAAYGARPANRRRYMQRPGPLDPAGVARAIVSIVSGEEHARRNAAHRDRQGARGGLTASSPKRCSPVRRPISRRPARPPGSAGGSPAAERIDRLQGIKLPAPSLAIRWVSAQAGRVSCVTRLRFSGRDP